MEFLYYDFSPSHYFDTQEFDIPENESCESQTVSAATRRNRQLPLKNRTRGDVGVEL